MIEEKINLRLLWKRFAADNMKIFFGDAEGRATNALVLTKVVAFIDTEFSIVNSYLLQVREGQSVYGLDMSFRFKKPEYADYKEVLLFVDKAGPDIAFRALAKEAVWCDIKQLTKDGPNY